MDRSRQFELWLAAGWLAGCWLAGWMAGDVIDDFFFFFFRDRLRQFELRRLAGWLAGWLLPGLGLGSQPAKKKTNKQTKEKQEKKIKKTWFSKLWSWALHSLENHVFFLFFFFLGGGGWLAGLAAGWLGTCLGWAGLPASQKKRKEKKNRKTKKNMVFQTMGLGSP